MGYSEKAKDKIVLNVVEKNVGTVVIEFTDGSQLIINSLELEDDLEISFLDANDNIMQLKKSLNVIDKSLIETLEKRDRTIKKLKLFNK